MKISVCVATYNGELYIKEQLDSILMQLSYDDEVIISDDSSIDKTLEIIQEIDDRRISIYKDNLFKSPIYNFENALYHSSGDIIVLSDQDDVWLPYKIEVIKATIKKHLLIFSNAMVVNQYLEERTALYSNSNQTGLFRNIVKNRYVGATIAFKRELLEVALPFPKEISMHDQWLGLLAEIYGSTYYIDIPLIYYRRHEANASGTSTKSKNSFRIKCLFRFKMLKCLIYRCLKYAF